MQHPHSGKSYDIRVGPMMSEIVLIKAYRGANYQPGVGKNKVILGDSVLRKMALESGFKVNRKNNTDIVIYKAWHENGFVQLYQNNSKHCVLTEVLEFTLTNMHIDGIEGDTIT